MTLQENWDNCTTPHCMIWLVSERSNLNTETIVECVLRCIEFHNVDSTLQVVINLIRNYARGKISYTLLVNCQEIVNAHAVPPIRELGQFA